MKRFLGIFLLLVTLTACSTHEVEFLEAQALEISSFTPGTLPSGILGAPYAASVSAVGASGPFSWRISAGKLPRGLSLTKNIGSGTTKILGTPTQIGTSTFTIQVKNNAGETATSTFTLTIN